MHSIERRLDIVDYFYERSGLLDEIRLALKSSNDAQRALQRLSLKKGQHSDLLELKWTFQSMNTIKQQIVKSLKVIEKGTSKATDQVRKQALTTMLDSLDTHEHLVEAITKAIDEDYVLTRNTKDNRDFGYVNIRCE